MRVIKFEKLSHLGNKIFPKYKPFGIIILMVLYNVYVIILGLSVFLDSGSYSIKGNGMFKCPVIYNCDLKRHFV